MTCSHCDLPVEEAGPCPECGSYYVQIRPASEPEPEEGERVWYDIGKIKQRLGIAMQLIRDEAKQAKHVENAALREGKETDLGGGAGYYVWWCVVRLHAWARGRIDDGELLSGRLHVRELTEKALAWTHKKGLHRHRRPRTQETEDDG